MEIVNFVSNFIASVDSSTLLYIMAGAVVGFAVGVTGVGGGSLMTPLLLMFGFPPATAIGTDLLYAAITKSNGVIAYYKQQLINWRVTLIMGAGSVPASLITVVVLHFYFKDANDYAHILTSTLGVMLILTAGVLLFRSQIQEKATQFRRDPNSHGYRTHPYLWTFIIGLLLGALVTLSSVGAGAFGTAVLMLLYPRWKSLEIVGTDLAHAVPLTLVAGLGHLFLGHVDWTLLVSLLIGSLPAIMIGAKIAAKLPDQLLKYILSFVLGAMGIKYAFF